MGNQRGFPGRSKILAESWSLKKSNPGKVRSWDVWKWRYKGSRPKKSTSFKKLKVFSMTRVWEWSGKSAIGDCTWHHITKHFKIILRSINLILGTRRRYWRAFNLVWHHQIYILESFSLFYLSYYVYMYYGIYQGRLNIFRCLYCRKVWKLFCKL